MIIFNNTALGRAVYGFLFILMIYPLSLIELVLAISYWLNTGISIHNTPYEDFATDTIKKFIILDIQSL